MGTASDKALNAVRRIGGQYGYVTMLLQQLIASLDYNNKLLATDILEMYVSVK